MINVVNIKTHKPTKNDFYIGRAFSMCNSEGCTKLKASPLANKWRIDINTTRYRAIAMYKQWFDNRVYKAINPLSPALSEYIYNLRSLYPDTEKESSEIKTELAKILTHLKTHGTVNLVCFCAPQACHSDVIKEFLEKWK